MDRSNKSKNVSFCKMPPFWMIYVLYYWSDINNAHIDKEYCNITAQGGANSNSVVVKFNNKCIINYMFLYFIYFLSIMDIMFYS